MFDFISGCCTKRLLINIFLGTGIPLLMTSAVFVLDQIKPDILLPGVGTEGCFLTPEGEHKDQNLG